MKNKLKELRCPACRMASLEEKMLTTTATVRGETLNLDCPGLKCPKCGYETVGAMHLDGYLRAAADAYRISGLGDTTRS